MKATLVLLLVGLAATTSHAEQLMDGKRLKADCQANMRMVEAYVAGWHDKREVDGYFADMVGKQYGGDPDSSAIMRSSVLGRYCLPDDARLSSIADAVCSYLAEHPLEISHKAVGLVTAAMEKRYPCK